MTQQYVTHKVQFTIMCVRYQHYDVNMVIVEETNYLFLFYCYEYIYKFRLSL